MKVFDFTPQNAFLIVSAAARKAGVGEIRPHDLRRTFAKLSRKGGASLEQVKVTLGHANLRTTELYLGTELEIRTGKACGDFMGDPGEENNS